MDEVKKEIIYQSSLGYLIKCGHSLEEAKKIAELRVLYLEAMERGSHPDLRV